MLHWNIITISTTNYGKILNDPESIDKQWCWNKCGTLIWINRKKVDSLTKRVDKTLFINIIEKKDTCMSWNWLETPDWR